MEFQSGAALPLFWSKDYWRANSQRSLRKIENRYSPGSIIYSSISSDRVSVPGKATFGGWWPLTASFQSVAVYEQMFRNLVAEEPAKSWEFTLPPEHFYPEVFLPQRAALENLGGSVVCEINSTIMLRDLAGGGDTTNFSRGNRKRVRAFLERGGTVNPAQPHEVHEAYDLLAQNRSRRGVSLSLTPEKFQTLLRTLPDIYSLWLARLDDELVGAAYLVKLSTDVSYVLFWGDSLAGREVSATAAICLFLQETLFREGKSFLDLGISSLRGIADAGLLKFKQNLGAISFDQPQINFSRTEVLQLRRSL